MTEFAPTDGVVIFELETAHIGSDGRFSENPVWATVKRHHPYNFLVSLPNHARVLLNQHRLIGISPKLAEEIGLDPQRLWAFGAWTL